MTFDDLLVQLEAAGGGALKCVIVDTAEAKSRPVPLGPLKVVEHRPVRVATHVDTARQRIVDRAQAARQVADAAVVVLIAVGDAALSHEDGEAVATPELVDDNAERRGRQVPSHVAHLEQRVMWVALQHSAPHRLLAADHVGRLVVVDAVLRLATTAGAAGATAARAAAAALGASVGPAGEGREQRAPIRSGTRRARSC